MRKLLVSSALFALVTACANDEAAENEPEPGDIVEEAAETTGDVIENVGEEISAAVNDAAEGAAEFAENELSQSNARGFTVRNLIGESVSDADGQVLAVVDDLLFTEDGQLAAVVLRDSAILGFGGDNAVVSADRFQFAVASDGDMVISAQMNDGELKQMTESLAYEPTEGVINPGNLISMNRFLDQPVKNINGDEVADPFDIMLAPPGVWDDIVVSVGGVGAIGNRLVLIDDSLIDFDKDSQGLRLNQAAPDLKTLPTFEYD